MPGKETETTEVVIIGAGQAGIAMSEHLQSRGVPHIVLEKNRIAEAWQSRRWDSLVANGPAWHDRFPTQEFDGVDPDGFATKDQVAEYFRTLVERNDLPVRTGVTVTSVTERENARGYLVETDQGSIAADYVVAATGPFQTPVIPTIIDESSGITQIHSNSYKNPAQLDEGAVLVVGAGSSGVQIAAEIQKAGKKVYLAVGPHDRPPRAYRNRDFCWWLGALGKWDLAAPPVGADHVTIAVSGAEGGHTVDFRNLAASGITLLGRANSYADGKLQIGSDLAANIARGDDNYLSLLREADEYIERNGLDLPPEPEAHELGADPECVSDPILELDLAEADVRTVIWATGFGVDYSWLAVDGVLDERGYPVQQRGVTPVPGMYFLGLPWLSRRGSSFIWGVWHDAKYLADQIEIQRKYRDYEPDHQTALASAAS
ncbi:MULTISPECIES: NAD(P)/FAD-dependent oxidoreductase [unclassified Brevibacterium]|uniref:flavin-containing monooxygenase n=1 Tax=unclassified Brevibacterium TaxID=2614124 RepID=UPI001E5EC0EA|nr:MULTISPECIES: NAD(P)/FAD-dependent oxidoreductase [unclassified Brevibacterium]MCD1286042.1 FAD-dependent oxidoreductase [Brevibacterium sp. CCUG 69071]MDK8433393.1 NAD(P)/FAD-dependent oxidoreductase [Brevibacterium sp. H-BE7]